jgi:hypothetical protein
MFQVLYSPGAGAANALKKMNKGDLAPAVSCGWIGNWSAISKDFSPIQ